MQNRSRRKVKNTVTSPTQISVKHRYPTALKEMRKIFNGAEQVIVPKFVTRFAKKYPLEVGGLVKAYPTKLKGKRVVVIAPRKDSALVDSYGLKNVHYTPEFINLYTGSNEARAEQIKKNGMIGTFHTHPSSFRGKKYEHPSEWDINSASALFLASLVVAPKKTNLFLPFDVTKGTKLKTKTLNIAFANLYTVPNDLTGKAKIIPVTIKSDKEVWNLLRRVKKKR